MLTQRVNKSSDGVAAAPKIICFDLEGPLSPQDNAYEVMVLAYSRTLDLDPADRGLTKNGGRVFEVLSRYDDYLTLRKRAGYEPGYTLALIVPFLLIRGITEGDIHKASLQAKIVNGSRELISMLKKAGWKVYIISTSYEQHAYNIGARVGVPQRNIRCTKLKPQELRQKLTREDIAIIRKAEEDILQLYPYLDDEEKIVRRLDRFYFEELQDSGYGSVFERVRVVGGERKVEAVKDIVKENHGKLEETIVVGDSITDYKMLDLIKREGGLAIVFNGNEYSVPYANIGLASTDIRFIQILADSFSKGRDKVEAIVKAWEERRQEFQNRSLSNIPEDMTTPEIRRFLSQMDIEFPHFSFLNDASEEKIAEVVKIHKRFRTLVRGEAAKLG